MMGYGNWGGYSGMMNSGFGVLATAFWLVILFDLILLGIWFWKQINKK